MSGNYLIPKSETTLSGEILENYFLPGFVFSQLKLWKITFISTLLSVNGISKSNPQTIDECKGKKLPDLVISQTCQSVSMVN